MKIEESKLTRLSSIAEILSSIAVVVTLIFLAVQISQNTDAINAQIVSTKSEARAAIWGSAVRPIEYAIEYPEITLNLSSDSPLSEIEESRLNMWLFAVFASREFVWLQYKDGVVDEASFQTMIDDDIFSVPRAREWWKENAEAKFDAQFVELINSKMSATPDE